MYQRLHVEFLVREDDTVLAYEERGKLNQSGMSQYEKGIQALSHLDRTQQVEVLQGILDMLILSSLFTGSFMFVCDIRPCYSKLFAWSHPIFSFIIILAPRPPGCGVCGCKKDLSPSSLEQLLSDKGCLVAKWCYSLQHLKSVFFKVVSISFLLFFL